MTAKYSAFAMHEERVSRSRDQAYIHQCSPRPQKWAIPCRDNRLHTEPRELQARERDGGVDSRWVLTVVMTILRSWDQMAMNGGTENPDVWPASGGSRNRPHPHGGQSVSEVAGLFLILASDGPSGARK